MLIIKFLKGWGIYNTGETAGFSVDVVNKIPYEIYQIVAENGKLIDPKEYFKEDEAVETKKKPAKKGKE